MAEGQVFEDTDRFGVNPVVVINEDADGRIDLAQLETELQRYADRKLKIGVVGTGNRGRHLLNILLKMYDESVQAHGTRLPYTDYHVIESDERGMKPFNSSGLVVVPRGSFRTPDKPTIYGVLSPELNKEWGKDALRLQAVGTKD